ncbi:MAG: response regulator [Deltaproteobacteria bacterium]|nr:MAG: response regulator [Deltaproteobacteria bacterium]
MAGKCGKTVLVVEDDADVREAIAEVLSDCEYKPLHASNGAEALQRLRTAEVRPCVILLDVMMPTMDGWQFRAAQKSDPSVSDIPVVVLSAHANGSEAAAKMDAAAYLAKPVSLERLVTVVERFCGVEQG